MIGEREEPVMKNLPLEVWPGTSSIGITGAGVSHAESQARTHHRRSTIRL